MKFYFPYLIFIIFIISNKLFLFNEEFLILLCFTAFCFSIYIKLSSSIQNRFNDKIKLDKSLILESLITLEKNLIHKYSLNKKTLEYKSLFFLLKNHYKNLSNQFVKNLLNYLDNINKSNLVTKLIVFSRIESEYSRLIFLLINKKISSISSLLFFFTNVLPINRFKIFNKINKLILLKKI